MSLGFYVCSAVVGVRPEGGLRNFYHKSACLLLPPAETLQL